MWGLRSPTPRGRTESCTLHILADVLTGAHGKDLYVGWRGHSSGFGVQRSERALRAGLPECFSARTLGLVPSRSLAQERFCYAVSFPSMPTERSHSILFTR